MNDVAPYDSGVYTPPPMPEWRPPDQVLAQAYHPNDVAPFDSGVYAPPPMAPLPTRPINEVAPVDTRGIEIQTPDAIARAQQAQWADLHWSQPMDVTSGAGGFNAAQAALGGNPFGQVFAGDLQNATGPLAPVNEAAQGAWESTLGAIGLDAQKIREALDPNVRYTASIAFDTKMAQLAQARGVRTDDPSLVGDRLQVAREIFNTIQERQPGETVEQTAARSQYGLTAGQGFKGTASLVNPLYAIGPGEVGGLISTGARAGRAAAGSRFATEELGMAIPDLGLSAVLKRVDNEARSRIEQLRAALGDSPATIAHHPDVKAMLKDAIVAEGEAPTAQNMTQVVRAIMDGPTLGAEQAARDIGGVVEQQAKDAIPKTADLQAAHVQDVAPLGDAVPSTGVELPKAGSIRATGAELKRIATEIDAGSPADPWVSGRRTFGVQTPAQYDSGSGLLQGVTSKGMSPEYRTYFEEKVQPVMELRQNILDAQKRLKEIETGPAAAYVRLTDPGDQLLWYEEHHPDVISKSFADAYIRPPEEILNQGGDTVEKFRQHLIDMANESVKKATTDETERFGSPVHEYPELGTSSKDAALRIDAERTLLQQQLATDHQKALDLIAQHRGGADRAATPVTVPGEISGTQQAVLPGTPPAEAGNLTLDNPTVSEAAARSTRVEASQEGLFTHPSGAVTRAPEPGTNLERMLAEGTSQSRLPEDVRLADQAAQDAKKVSPSGNVALAKGPLETVPQTEVGKFSVVDSTGKTVAKDLSEADATKMVTDFGGANVPPNVPPTATADPLFPDRGPDVPQDSIQTAGGPLDLNKAIDMLTSDTRLEKTKTIGHRQTMDEAAALLKSGKISEDTLFTMAETGANREALNAAEVIAYDQLVGGLADRAARAAEAGSGDMFDRITEAVAAKQKWRAIMEEPGRATEAMKMLSDSGELARDATDVTARAIEMFGGITEQAVRDELTAAFKEFLAAVPDPALRESAARNFITQFGELMDDAAAQRALDEIQPVKRPGVIRGVLADLRNSNLLGYLGGTKNLVTNEVKVAAIIERYAVAAAIPGSPQRLADLAPALKAMRTATLVGARDGWDVIVHGPGQRELAGRFYEGREETIPRLLGNVTEKVGLGRGAGENVGGAIMGSVRYQAAGDVLTRTQLERFFEVTRSAQLLREKGLTGAKYDQALVKAIAKPRASVRLEAERFGRVETWNEARDKIKYMQAIGNGVDHIEALRAAPSYAISAGIAATREATDPVLSTIIPFFQTRLNMLDEGVNWTPVGALRIAKEWRGLSAAERADRIAQTATGTAGLGVAAATLLGTDTVTGSGPVDVQKNIEWSKDHQPYSISIPGIGWVSYLDTLGPLGTGIAFVADYADAAKYDGHWPDDRTLGASMAHFSKTIFNQAGFLQNLNDFLNTAVSPSDTKWAALTANVVREYLPAGVGTSNLRVARNIEGTDSPKYDKWLSFPDQVIQRVRGGIPPEVGGIPADQGMYQRPRTGLRAALPITTQEDTSTKDPGHTPMLQLAGAGAAAGATPSASPGPASPGGRYIPPARR